MKVMSQASHAAFVLAFPLPVFNHNVHLTFYDATLFELSNNDGYILLKLGLVAQWITRLTTDQKTLGSTPG